MYFAKHVHNQQSGVTHIRTRFTLLAVAVGRLLIKAVVQLYWLLTWVVRLIFKPIIFVYAKIFKPIILSFYLVLFSGKKFWKTFLKTSHNAWHRVINQRLTLYIVFGMLALTIVTTNIQAQDTPPEDLGKNSIMYGLVTPNHSLGVIEDATRANTQQPDIDLPDDTAIASLDETVQNITTEDNTLSVTGAGSALLAANETQGLKPRTGIEEYEVQPGDTVTSIAKQFGISVNTILWSNGLTSNSIIRPGDVIKILPVSGTLHKVISGDTIGALARKYQTSEEDIYQANGVEATRLAIGSNLIIPGGVPPAPVITRQPTQTAVTPVLDPNPPAAVDTGSKLLWPANSHRINQYYSWRHVGLDIDGEWGDPIYASEDGKVEVSGWNNGGYGNYIIINHGNGIKTLYAHNSQNLVSVDDSVSRGQVIGYIGSTGRSTGAHIHYEVRVNNSTANPLLYTQ